MVFYSVYFYMQVSTQMECKMLPKLYMYMYDI